MNVLHVFKILLSTTFTNAKAERMFSRMARIKTDWGNCLGHDWLKSLLRISDEGQSLEKFDPNPGSRVGLMKSQVSYFVVPQVPRET